MLKKEKKKKKEKLHLTSIYEFLLLKKKGEKLYVAAQRTTRVSKQEQFSRNLK